MSSNTALNPGDRLTSQANRSVEVKKFLGAGGQGAVYLVNVDGQSKALKWYHNDGSDSARRRLELQRKALIGNGGLVAKGPPDPRFLWPEDFVENNQSFGYLMPLREGDYVDFEYLVAGHPTARAKGPRELVTAAIGLADCFRTLHIDGLVYSDINLGGPFYNPQTGEILICDNDNVRINNTPINIMFMQFAAPELILGQSGCNRHTDFYSMAILLYYMFVRDHPMEGKLEAELNCFDEKAKKRLYAESPVFVHDPNDRSNAPVPGVHVGNLNNWPCFPKFIQDAFTQTFTEGPKDKSKRLTDGQWLTALSKLRDSLYQCSSCGKETFYCRDAFAQNGSLTCMYCKKTAPTTPRMKVGNNVVMLSQNTKLYAHHLGDKNNFSVVGEMAQHPKDPTRWGIKNCSTQNWTFKADDGQLKEVGPGRSAPLKNGLELNFGREVGMIRT